MLDHTVGCAGKAAATKKKILLSSDDDDSDVMSDGDFVPVKKAPAKPKAAAAKPAAPKKAAAAAGDGPSTSGKVCARVLSMWRLWCTRFDHNLVQHRSA
jgi:hypothetical protein